MVHGHDVELNLLMEVLQDAVSHGHGLLDGDGAFRATSAAVAAALAGLLVHYHLAVAIAEVDGVLRAVGIGAVAATRTQVVVHGGGPTAWHEAPLDVARPVLRGSMPTQQQGQQKHISRNESIWSFLKPQISCSTCTHSD